VSEQDKLQAQIALLLPVQQQTIAMAQLAGCSFEPKMTERHIGYVSGNYSSNWVMTTLYVATLPDGTVFGLFEDLYGAAVACLDHLNGHNEPIKLDPDLFRLLPENEQP